MPVVDCFKKKFFFTLSIQGTLKLQIGEFCRFSQGFVIVVDFLFENSFLFGTLWVLLHNFRTDEFLYSLRVTRMGITTEELICSIPFSRNVLWQAPFTIPTGNRVAVSDHSSYVITPMLLAKVHPLSFRHNVKLWPTAKLAFTII